ncbi:hypothetical protein [Ruminococcus albus]|uniref:Uncharacterized protein n=1 Tax=Ruminococcus albus TaxID=1264 RepID=A0A1H7HUK5_RUMAL|nr:hypothetical protein [Ruminococcus albus]SEK51875.1 hypothetical protein SAMN05216469_10324 [Ruminococcus albus]
MWWYKNVTRAEFEAVKDKVGKIMLSMGAEISDIELPCGQKTTSCSGDFEESHISNRPVFTYNGEYYCVDEVLFRDKPFIVIAFGTKDDLLKNTMEDAEPFPYDLPDDELPKEVSYSLGILPYPEV